MFLYYVAAPWNLIGRTDPVGGEAGYQQVAARAQEQLQQTGATWIATSDYRTYAMLRWYFNGRVPVIQINERGRFQGFRDPGMNLIKDQPGLYVAREPDNRLPLWDLTTAKRQPLERVERVWRGTVMDTYALEKLTGWTPELSPPPDSPLFRWRVLAGDIEFWQGYVVVQSSVLPRHSGMRHLAQARNPFHHSFSCLMDSGSRCARPGMTTRYDFAISRRVTSEICTILVPSSKQRAQGRPGARCTRGLVCNCAQKTRTRAYRFSGNTPAFPAQWLYGL